MGFVAGLFAESPNDEAEFWRTWNTTSRRERRTLLKRLGREKGRVFNEKDARKQLADWVRLNIFAQSGGGGARRRRR